MIELIFVIVIIGILAAVAIPKLAGTRDDAKVSRSLLNLKVCIRDIGTGYTARQEEDNTSAACESVVVDGCFQVTGVQLTTPDGDVNGTHITTNTEPWCVEAQGIASEQNLSQATPGQEHSFGGSKVVR